MKQFLSFILLLSVVEANADTRCGENLSNREMVTLGQEYFTKTTALQKKFDQGPDTKLRQSSLDNDQFELKLSTRLKKLDIEFSKGFTKSKIVQGITIERFLAMNLVGHCGLRAQKDSQFYQVEVHAAMNIKQGGAMSGAKRLSKDVSIFGITMPDDLGIFEFNNKSIRERMNSSEPPIGTMPVCIVPGTTKRSYESYLSCIKQVVRRNPNETQDWNPVTNNCCHFDEDILARCGLAPCFTLPQINGLLHKTGTLEYVPEQKCLKTQY